MHICGNYCIFVRRIDNQPIFQVQMKENKKTEITIKKRTGFWLLIVAAIALESIALIQYFYSRQAIRKEAVYHAQAELRAAELEINVASREMEAAAKVLANMAEQHLDSPEAMFDCTHSLLTTLSNVESAGIAFTADYYPQKGHWFEVCSSRQNQSGSQDGIYTREIGNANHDYLQAEWFNNGLTIDSAWWSEPYIDEAGAGSMVVSCSYPIRDKNQRVVAVACIDFSINRLKNVSSHLKVYKDSYFSISSPSGSNIVTPPDTTPGRRYMVFNEDIDATGWHLSVIIPEDRLFAELNKVGFVVSLLMLISLGLLIFIMYRSGKNFMNLLSVSNQKERMEGELEIARTIQSAMLPKVFPPFSDRPDLNIYGMVKPAKEIGGDLYDFYVRHDKLFFCVGDVSGKGVPASLVMATIRSLFRSISAHTEDPSRIAGEMNDTIAESNDQNMFVTLFIGVLELENGTLRYCNAGHNAPVLIDTNHSQEMINVLPNLPIGIMRGFAYQAQVTHMTHGETLFLYTDGLTEAENNTHAQYGEQRMLNKLAGAGGMGSKEIVQMMEQSVEEFAGEAPQSDDLTILAIRYQLPALVMQNDIQQIPTLAEWVEGLSIPQELNMPVNLALEETVSNVMLYAYPGRDDGKVFVEYVQAQAEDCTRLVFTISDFGIPFDPTQKDEADISLTAEERPIGGLGIHLVRQLMDEIRYERVEDKNVLTLVKRI